MLLIFCLSKGILSLSRIRNYDLIRVNTLRLGEGCISGSTLQILLCPEKLVSIQYNKNKNLLPLKIYFSPQTLEPGYGLDWHHQLSSRINFLFIYNDLRKHYILIATCRTPESLAYFLTVNFTSCPETASEVAATYKWMIVFFPKTWDFNSVLLMAQPEWGWNKLQTLLK